MQSCYRCPVCLHPSFASAAALWQGLMSGASRRLACPLCAEVLLGLDKLTLHLYGHVAAAAPVPHPLLPQDAPLHIAVPAPQPPQPPPFAASEVAVASAPCNASAIVHRYCGQCGASFSSDHMLASHVALVHSAPTTSAAPQDFACHLCCRKFKMKGSLMVHMRFVHGAARKEAKHKRSKQQGPKSPPSAPDSNVHSPVSFPSMSELKDQLVAAEPSSPQVSGPPSQEEQPTVEPQSSWNQLVTSCLNENFKWDNKLWECEVCGKKFTTKYFQKKHQRLHTGERPYQCTTCGKSFAFQQSFHKHLLYHTSAKPHACAECGQSFKELSTLHNHQRIHTGERPFVCETCGKAFRQRVSYLVHRRIHTGALPYKCTVCDKAFRYKVSQRTHKCTAQPPGDLVRQSDLVQRLMSRSASADPPPPPLQQQPPPPQPLPPPASKPPEPLLTINEDSFRQLLAIFPP